ISANRDRLGPWARGIGCEDFAAGKDQIGRLMRGRAAEKQQEEKSAHRGIVVAELRAEESMADEKTVTETKTERKNDFFGNPKEEKTTTTEKTQENSFGDRKETTTTVERKEEE